MNKKINISNFDFTQLEEMLPEQGYTNVCGVDEVGRGPLAGPVVAAAVILPEYFEVEGLNDSKKLTPAKRDELFEELVISEAVCAVGIIDHECIDSFNILKASLMAMRKAVMDLKKAPDILLVDGSFHIPNITIPQYAIVKGDSRCKSIAAASIIAKVTRDRIMDRYEKMYPSFTFGKHKGYPTPDHLDELRAHGPCDIHRKTFKPVAEIINQYALF